jgi:hypothetical protein
MKIIIIIIIIINMRNKTINNSSTIFINTRPPLPEAVPRVVVVKALL